MNRARAGALVVLVAASACALRTRTPEPGPGEGEWAVVRNAATRRHILYDGVTHRASATATHLSLPVREARARRLAVWKGWTDAELARQLDADRAAAAAGEEFILVFYTGQWKNNDLDGVESIWRISVRTGETEMLASQVHAVDANAEVKNLFPWVGPFDTVYRLRFPRPPAGALGESGFLLQLASAVGKVELDYDLPPSPDVLMLLPAPPERR